MNTGKNTLSLSLRGGGGGRKGKKRGINHGSIRCAANCPGETSSSSLILKTNKIKNQRYICYASLTLRKRKFFPPPGLNSQHNIRGEIYSLISQDDEDFSLLLLLLHYSPFHLCCCY